MHQNQHRQRLPSLHRHDKPLIHHRQPRQHRIDVRNQRKPPKAPMQQRDRILIDPMLCRIGRIQPVVVERGQPLQCQLGIVVDAVCRGPDPEIGFGGEDGAVVLVQPGPGDLENLADALQEFEERGDVGGHAGCGQRGRGAEPVAVGGHARQGDAEGGGDDGVGEDGLAVDGRDVVEGLAEGRDGAVVVFQRGVDIREGGGGLGQAVGDVQRGEREHAVHQEVVAQRLARQHDLPGVLFRVLDAETLVCFRGELVHQLEIAQGRGTRKGAGGHGNRRGGDGRRRRRRGERSLVAGIAGRGRGGGRRGARCWALEPVVDGACIVAVELAAGALQTRRAILVALCSRSVEYSYIGRGARTDLDAALLALVAAVARLLVRTARRHLDSR